MRTRPAANRASSSGRDELGEPVVVVGSPTRRAPARARSSRNGRTQGQTPWTSRRNTAAPVGPMPLTSCSERAARSTSSLGRRGETAQIAAVLLEDERGHLPQPGGGALVVAAVAAAAERRDDADRLRVAHALRRRPAGRAQLGRRRDGDARADARGEQLREDEQLEERRRLVGQPDAGLVGVRPAVTVEHALGRRPRGSGSCAVPTLQRDCRRSSQPWTRLLSTDLFDLRFLSYRAAYSSLIRSIDGGGR